MALKLYDLVNIAEEIENATIYVENYTNEEVDGKEIHRVEITVENTDTEEVSDPLILEEESKQALDRQVKFTLGAYFKKIDVVNKLY
jgi:hypothetical protein